MEQSGKSDHPPTPELVNNGDEFGTSFICILEEKRRCKVPYVLSYVTHCVHFLLYDTVPGEFVVVNGLRYVIPYHNRMLLSVKDQFIGIKVDEMLGNIFRRHRGEQVRKDISVLNILTMFSCVCLTCNFNNRKQL